MIKRFILTTIKKKICDLLGITELDARVNFVLEVLDSSTEELWERSRIRWRESKPNSNLTWGRQITGDNFMSKVSRYGVFHFDTTILEVGAGYGRLLKACLNQNIPFKKYVAVDISEQSVNYLRKTFPTKNIAVIHGDVEKIVLPTKVDVVLSSLTFKHLFPSFEKALSNITQYVKLGGMVFFDLREGHTRVFEKDGITYNRSYMKSEILEILSKVGLKFVAFDRVQHDYPNYSRLLVVAKKYV